MPSLRSSRPNTTPATRNTASTPRSGIFVTKWESHLNSRIVSLGLLLLLPACRGGGPEKEANAAQDPAGGGKQSCGKEDYAGIRCGKVDKGDVSVLLPEVGTLSPV